MRKIFSALMIVPFLSIWMTGCGQMDNVRVIENDSMQEEIVTDTSNVISLDSEITELEKGFKAVKFEGNDGFEEFLSQVALLLIRKSSVFLRSICLPEQI